MSMNNIFLINNGLSCQEIYENLFEYYRFKKKQGLVFDSESIETLKKIKREKNNKLSLNGIIESREMKKNDNMNLLKDHNNYFYCLCDRISIETALIFLNKQKPHCILIILPFIKYEKSIKKANDITNFKNSFGNRNNNNMKNYWNIDSELINYNKSVIIDWRQIDSLEFSQIKNYSINKLMSDILDYRLNRVQPSLDIILFCNHIVIRNFLNTVKVSKFKPDSKMKIFNTHCFKLEYHLNTTRRNLELTEYSSYYPQKLGTNNIKYTFEGKKYDLLFKYFSRKVLTNKLNIIPKSRCIDSSKLEKLVNYLKNGKINKNKKNIQSKNINNVNNFNNLFSSLNK